jgi:WD40 repeat protein
LAAGLCERQYCVTALPAAIQCIDYWFDPSKLNYSILTFGDMGGNVGAFIFHRTTQGLFATKKQDHCIRIPFVEVLKQKRSALCTAVWFDKVHDDWSKKVKYCHGLDSFMSCSCDSKAAVVLGSMFGRNDRTNFRISKGVNAFDYSQDWNCIVTGGVDRLIRIWSPHVNSKPTSVMKGHNVAITHLTLCEKDAHIYSLSKDKMFKVWDLRDQSCIQTIARLQSLGTAPVSLMFYNTHNHCLFMAASQVGILEPNNSEITEYCSTTSHEKPVLAALYNSNFNQVLSSPLIASYPYSMKLTLGCEWLL